jgi:hypothetical protein
MENGESEISAVYFPFPIPRSRFPLFRLGEIALEYALRRHRI